MTGVQTCALPICLLTWHRQVSFLVSDLLVHAEAEADAGALGHEGDDDSADSCGGDDVDMPDSALPVLGGFGELD